MKSETLMLQSLFAACLLICVLTLGAMFATPSIASSAAVSHAPVAPMASSAG
ncbi:hypothetical protein [Dyella subtropica]|uniref:hypothetical protein n=1 Tax=Dyella subtropica TaxID=2992127 RepID=UPI00225B19F3|nr:hypothetical protein [Dyella subtropica]